MYCLFKLSRRAIVVLALLVLAELVPSSDAVAKLIAQGVKAQYALSVDPSLTAPAHISIATASYPDKRGIVSNNFHTVTDRLVDSFCRTMETSGFEAPIQVETLWEAAKRQGKKVITIAFAGADATSEARRGDVTLAFVGVSDGDSFVKTMNASHFGPATGWNLGGRSFERARANLANSTASRVFFELRNRQKFDINVLIADTTFDGKENYDTAFFDFNKDLSDCFQAELKAGQWGAIALPIKPEPAVVGSWIKLLALKPDLSEIKLYLGDVSHNAGYPEEFVQTIDKNVGFWPVGPDSFQLQAGRIDETTYLEQLERLANYLRDATLFVMKNFEWDLLLTYQPQTDEAGHQFLLIDPRQKGFKDEAKRKRFEKYVQVGLSVGR